LLGINPNSPTTLAGFDNYIGDDLYNPVESNTSYFFDVLRYKENNWVGKYVSDNIQFNSTAAGKASNVTVKN
jgi:hypothetical protein